MSRTAIARPVLLHVQPDDVPYRVAFAQLESHSLSALEECLTAFQTHGGAGDARAAWHAPARDWHGLRVSAAGQRLAAELLERRRSLDPQRYLEDLAARGVRVTVYGASDYPSALEHISQPPAVLYYRGRLEGLSRPCVGVVGTRRASDYGLKAARFFSTGLARAGAAVISGMAYGIDQAAHQACLQAGGITFAVLGCGPEMCYPENATRLKAEIEASGAVISQFAPGVEPLKGHFPARNRIISGLSHAVLVVEAPAKSGAIITADFALDQGRELFAVPGNIFSANAAGTHRLLADKVARPAVEPADVLSLIGVACHEQPMAFPGGEPATGPALELDETTTRVWSVLSGEQAGGDVFEAVDLEDILRRSGEPLTAVLRSLTRLELEGLIRRRVGNTYQRKR
jgi:DNA processing protein